MASRHLRHSFTSLLHRLFDRTRTAGVRRRRPRHRSDCLGTQRLEQRIALAVDVIGQPVETPRRALTVLVTPGDELYMTKFADTATVGSSAGDLRYDLWVADSSTFSNRKTVEGIDAYDTISVLTGSVKEDIGVRAKTYPMTTGSTTTFALSKTRVMDWRQGGPNDSTPGGFTGGELFGTLSLQQPDGTTSVWSFTSWDGDTTRQRYDLSNIRITGGPGIASPSSPLWRTTPRPLVTSSFQPGYYFPKTIVLGNNSTTDSEGIDQQAATLDVEWNQPLTAAQNPTVPSITYDRATFTDAGRSAGPTRQTDENIIASVLPTASFQLPGVLDQTSLGLIPGSMSGTITVRTGTASAGKSLQFLTRQSDDSGTFDPNLYFPVTGLFPERYFPVTGNTSAASEVLQEKESYVLMDDGSYLFVRGTYDEGGTITLFFYTRDLTFRDNGELGGFYVFLGTQAPGEVTLTAKYAVSETGPKGSAVTLFAGHTLTNNLDVDLLTPGSSLLIDTPLAARKRISIAATNVTFNSNTTAADLIAVGPTDFAFNEARSLQAQAVAVIKDGRVDQLIPVVGFEGAGYDSDNPPLIVIADPPSATTQLSVETKESSRILRDLPTASLKVGMRVSGRGISADTVITNIDRTTNIVTLSNAATQNQSQVLLTFTNSQPRYQARVDRVTGRITGYDAIDKGSGYESAPAVTIAKPTAIAASAEATAVVSGGAIARIDAPGEVVIDPAKLSSGSGYTAAPTVTFAAPGRGAATDRAATGEARIVNGKVVAITITDPGRGYFVGETVAVAIAAPASGGTTATAEAYVATGYGYREPPIVTIDPPSRAGGTQAVATAEIDGEGRIKRFNTPSPAGSGYDSASPPKVVVTAAVPIASAESVRFKTTVAAPTYKLVTADDPGTPGTRRGQILMSQTSVLGGANGTNADLITVQADQTDILLEGEVRAAVQSWYLSSDQSVAALAPFRFTTKSATGQQTGLLSGGVVQLVLANDAPTPSDDNAVAFNTIDLKTDVASLRVRAASRRGESWREPFPYELSITEDDTLNLDTVAASSFPITLTVGKTLNFNATLATAGGLVIYAGDDFNLNAPVTSNRGPIAITATNVILGNALRVGEDTGSTPSDTLRDDVVLTATGGDIVVNDYLRAVNRVRLVQRNSTTPRPVTRRYSGPPIAIPDSGSTVAAEIPLTDDFTFTKLQVEVNIAHTYDGDLTGWLVAPDGTTRLRLFQNVGGSGDNFTNTVFDSDAPQSIFFGTAPFTGAFRPVDSLAPLAGRKATGTWKLEVRDSSGGDVGQITGFALVFTTAASQDGLVGGEGRIESDSIDIRAEGYVGSPDVSPADATFYLRTNTNTLEARVGQSAAISDIGTVSIPFLSAGGLVSLQSLGYDGTGEGKALRAQLFESTVIDVSAPNGSVKLDVFTPHNVVFGNAAAIASGTAIPMTAAGDVQIGISGGSNSTRVDILDAPLAGSGARQVRGVSAARLQGVYSPGQPGAYASTITATLPYLPLQTAAFGLTTPLRVGDRLLVAKGIAGDPADGTSTANGVYIVTSLGTTTTPWILSRAADSDTEAEIPTNTFVRRLDPATGGQAVYQLTYTGSFTTSPVKVVERPVVADIGSYDPLSQLRFVVSTEAGTNLGAGSLGKMLQLYQANKLSSQLQFGDSVDRIPLVEELPLIRRPIVIDAAASNRFDTGVEVADIKPVVIDGSRIVRMFDGTTAAPNSPIDGLRFAAGSDDSRLANVYAGGFFQGAAVSVDGVSRMRIDNVTLGRLPEPSDEKLLNNVGVHIKSTAESTTVMNSRIVSSRDAGVRIAANSSGVVLVGNTIGELTFDNYTGVVVEGGSHRIGAVVRPADTSFTAIVAPDAPEFLELNGYPVDRLYVGQRVAGQGITPGTEIVRIDGSRITLSAPVVLDAASRIGNVSLKIDFLTPPENKIASNLYGIRLLNGSTSVTNTVARNNAFVGIQIEGGRNTIGDSTELTPESSNEIHTSPGWGIVAKAPAGTIASSKELFDRQTIQGTYFIPEAAAEGDTSVQNKLGNVGIEYTDAGGARKQSYYGIGDVYKPVTDKEASDYGTDSLGNLHFAVVDRFPPTAQLGQPRDSSDASLAVINSGPNTIEVREGGRTAKTLVLELKDSGAGINKATIVKEAFSIARNGTALVEGIDYTFDFKSDAVLLQAIGGVFPLGNYVLTVTSRKASGMQAGWVTDMNNNPLKDDNTLEPWSQRFEIVLVDRPDRPLNIRAVAGDGKVEVSWDAAVSSPEIEYYEVQYSLSNSGNAVYKTFEPKSASLNASITDLTNGTPYYFRVAAWNSIGRSDWSQAGPVTPLAKPTVRLDSDTGVRSDDGLTRDGRVKVGVFDGAVWQYSIDAGKIWLTPSSPGTKTFQLPAGQYDIGQVQVRQALGTSQSAPGFNEIVFDIDTVAPRLKSLTSSSPNKAYGLGEAITITATLSEAVRKDDVLDVTLDTGAVVTLKAPAQGTQLEGVYVVGPEQNSADLTAIGYTIGTAEDRAGNRMSSTTLPLPGDNIGGSKAIVVDTSAPKNTLISDILDDVPPVVGRVPDGGVTNDTVLLLKGTAEAGGSVVVYGNGERLGTATLVGTVWTYTTPTLDTGKTYSFTARGIDSVNNESLDSTPYAVTIDTQPPAAPVITGVLDNIAPRTGTIANGGIANDDVLDLSGTTEENSLVRVYAGGELQGNATVTGTTWTYTTRRLGDGVYSFVARATDRAGNDGPDSAAYTVTVKTAGSTPLITGVTDNVAPVTGNVRNGGATNDTTLVISGITEVGSTVQLFDGDRPLEGNATVIGFTWTYDTRQLANGATYAFKAQATDSAGNTGEFSSPYRVTVKTMPPVAPTIAGHQRDVLAGTVEAGCTVEVFQSVPAPATKLGFATVSGTDWTFSLSNLPDGTYDVMARATDAAGNESGESFPYRLTIDRTKPVTTIDQIKDDVEPVVGAIHNGGFTNDTTLVLAGSTNEADSIVQVFDGQTPLPGFATVSGTQWEYTTDFLIDGVTYDFRARSIDGDGNEGEFTPSHTVTIDATSPTVRRFQSTTADGAYSTGREIVIQAAMQEVVTVDSYIVATLDTGAVVVLRAKTQGDLLEGIYTVQAGHNSPDLTVVSFAAGSVTDQAGNVLDDLTMPADNIDGSKNIVIDTIAPTIRSVSTSTLAGFYRSGTVIAINAVASEPLQAGSSIVVTLNTGTPGAQVTLTAATQGRALSGTYVVAAGQNTSSLAVVGIRAVSGGDLAGNAVSTTLPDVNLPPGIEIDTIAPTITRFYSTSANGTYRSDSKIEIRADVSEPLQAGATVSVVLNTGAPPVLLAMVSASNEFVGEYDVQPGDVAANLEVLSMTVVSGRDRAGNILSVPPGIPNIPPGINVKGEITVLTPPGFSDDPGRIPDLRRTVTSIPIKFTTPVSGVSLANFRLLYNNRGVLRSVSIRNASISGSGDSYVLRLPSRATSPKGIYTLQILPTGIVAQANGRPMTDMVQWYWGNGRSVGMTAARLTTTVRR